MALKTGTEWPLARYDLLGAQAWTSRIENLGRICSLDAVLEVVKTNKSFLFIFMILKPAEKWLVVGNMRFHGDLKNKKNL